jgi:hypothetical protein
MLHSRCVEKVNKTIALSLVGRTTSPAPALFIYKALTAWAIPKLKGVQDVKRSTDMIVLPADFYDMNTWDPDGAPERTRRNWRTGIHKRMAQLEESAIIQVTEIFEAEQLFIDAA